MPALIAGIFFVNTFQWLCAVFVLRPFVRRGTFFLERVRWTLGLCLQVQGGLYLHGGARLFEYRTNKWKTIRRAKV